MDDRPLMPAPTIGALARVADRPAARGKAASLATRAGRLATPAAVLLLGALSMAFFWKVLLLHQALLPADILYARDPLWGPLAPQPAPRPFNPLDSDALTEFYPWTALAAGALHRGILPLWNPYAFAGTPFLGAMQTAVLYPVNLALELLLPPVDVLGARAIMHLALTLVGAFLFARRLALSRSAALLTALSFGLGLPYVVWLEHPMSGAVAWLPWMLLFIDLVLTARKRLWAWLGLTAAVALELLSGHGESTAHALLLCAAYALFRALLTRREGRAGTGLASLVLAGGALALGAAIAAAHLLPALAQISVSEAAADRTQALTTPRPSFLGDPAQWKTLVVALAPDFFGNPTWHVSTLPAFGYNEVALYVGSVPLLLAVLALWRRAASTLFWGLVALVALGMAVRLPILALLDSLPVLRVAQDGRLRFEYAFAVAVLAGYGLDSLVAAARQRAIVPFVWLWLLGLGACAAVGILLLLPMRSAGQAVAPATVARVALPMVWLALFAVALWLYRRGALGAARLRGVVPILCAADLFTLGAGYHATVPRDAVTATPPAVRAIQGDRSLYRVAGLGYALWPSLSSLYGLQDVRGYDPAYAAAYESYFAASFGAGGMRLGLADAGPSPAAARALDLMNVTYLFSACDVRLNPRYYRPVYRGGTGCVYRNLSAMPRAVIVHRVGWAAPERAAALLAGGAIDPRAMALLDPGTAHGFPSALVTTRRAGISPAPASASAGLAIPAGSGRRLPSRAHPGVRAGMARPALPGPTRAGHKALAVPILGREGARLAGPGAKGDSAQVTSYGLNRVDVAAYSAAPGVLVLGDAYAPGWRANVDGRPVTIARADAVFRVVALPAGSHQVRFTYEPVTFTFGARISLGALGLWGALILLAMGRSMVGLASSRSSRG